MGIQCLGKENQERVQNINKADIRVPDRDKTDIPERNEKKSKKKDSTEDEDQTEERLVNEELGKGYPSFDENKKTNSQKYKYIFCNPQPKKEPIIYDKIFLDGNSDNYDMILNFESFEQLKTYGWTANFSIDGWKKYQESIQSENIIIGVVGIKNRGKSFWLKRIMQNDNYKPNDGFLVNTFGISCGFPVLRKENNYQTFITIDSEGKDNPLLQNLFVEQNDIRSLMKDKKVCEILLSDFIIKECNILIAVVEQLSFAEQEMLISLINSLKLKEVNNNIEKRKLIVIHNLMNSSQVKDIENFVNDTLLKSMTFSLNPHHVDDHEDKKYNVTVYDQIIENNDNNRLDIVHIIVGNDNSKEVKEKYNEPALKYIRDYITISYVKQFDIINSFKEFIETNYKQFINNNLFDNNPLEIGYQKRIRVYTDKNKTKNKISEKIIIPIEVRNKEKIKDVTFKNFFFDSSGIYYSVEPLYASRIFKIKDDYFLEITFEISGKINEDLKTDINEDDNNNKIIIEIRGKTEEFKLDFFKEEEGKIDKEVGNLKCGQFIFQVNIDKYKIIEGEERDLEIKTPPVKNIDDICGIVSLIFPVTLHEVE